MIMADNAPKPFWSGKTKWIGLMIAGGITGFFAGSLGATALDEGGMLASLRGAEIALGTALLYLLMGAMVGIGTLSPRVGAAILNVEDAEEIREQGTSFASSAIGCILMAAVLIVVAMGSPQVALISPGLAGIVALVLSAVAAIASWRSRNAADELMRDLMRDAGATSFYILFVGLGIWAAAAHLGFVSAPQAIDIFGLLFATPLVAAFWAVGRKGMMRPRG